MSGDLWAFTLAAYGRPGVSAACIALQDTRGADVNLLFYACWRRGRLDAAAFAAAEGVVRDWRTRVVEPLRGVRNAIRAGIDGAPAEPAQALRKAVLGAEIEGERIAQAMLGAMPAEAEGGADHLADAAASLAVYLAGRGARGAGDREHARVLLAGCFPEANAEAITAAARTAVAVA